jgi:hypothetical protein
VIPVRHRWLTALELLIFSVWSGVYVWILLPLNRPALMALNGMALLFFTVASHLWRGTSLSDIGLRSSSFSGAFKLIGIPTIVIALAAVPVGFLLDSVQSKDFLEDWFEELVTYPIWGFVQQYTFQGYIFVRVYEATGRRNWIAIMVSATLYTLIHYPNVMLLTFCLPIGIVWSWVFSRHRNLYALGLSHGILGGTINVFIGNIYWAGLSVGPHLL